MLRTKTTLSTSQALFTFFFLIFFFTLLNGYLLNLVSGYRANAWLVLVGVVIELSAAILIARGRVSIQRDPLELAGFLIVVGGVWLYFVAASLPTLLPPTQSLDAVRHYLQVLHSYPDGRLVSWYPAGGAFISAMFAHWLGWPPLRVLHPTAASFIALSAGAMYGMTCTLLASLDPAAFAGQKRLSQVAALLAPALLFVPWSYFAGIVNWEQYFYAQAFAQYFAVAALWYIASYAERPHWIFAGLIGAALLGVIAAYPYLVALPLALFAMIALARVFPLPLAGGGMGRGLGLSSGPLSLRGKDERALAVLGIFIGLMVVAAIALQRGGILELKGAQLASVSDVGEGGVTNPSLENLGGPVFLLLALMGTPLAWRAGTVGKTVLAFLVAWLAQFAALLVVQPAFQISGYRLDKTFYILVFPFAILAALAPARAINHWSPLSSRGVVAAFVAMTIILGAGISILRPPVIFSPFTAAELQTALWAKDHLDTYQISYLDRQSIRSYWLAFGLWREALPNEWFQWIPAGVKLGPASFDEWRRDPAWPQWVWVGDVRTIRETPLSIVYQNGDSVILQKDVLPLAAPAPSQSARWYFGSTIKLLGYDLPRPTFSPGDAITLTTYTESIYPPSATVGWRVELLARGGKVVSKATGDPFANKYPLQRWPPGRYARDVWTLPLDSGIPPGVYTLQMGLYRRTDGQEIEVWFTEPVSGAVILDKKPLAAAPLTKIKIPLAQPSADELRAATPLQARVGDNFSLSSYVLQFDRSARVARLTLYWQSISKTENDYTVFVHLIDSAGKIIAQKDSQPLGGSYPTSIWDAQEIVKDDYALVLPADAPALPYSIEIGMYAYPSLKRLPVSDAKGATIGDHIVLDY